MEDHEGQIESLLRSWNIDKWKEAIMLCKHLNVENPELEIARRAHDLLDTDEDIEKHCLRYDFITIDCNCKYDLVKHPTVEGGYIMKIISNE